MPMMNSAPNLEELLDDLIFPAAKMDLLAVAEDHDASEDSLELLRALPKEEYGSLPDLNKDLGLVGRGRGDENLWPSEESHALPNKSTNMITKAIGKGKVV